MSNYDTGDFADLKLAHRSSDCRYYCKVKTKKERSYVTGVKCPIFFDRMIHTTAQSHRPINPLPACLLCQI